MIERWEPYAYTTGNVHQHTSGIGAEMQKDEDGEYVLYADHKRVEDTLLTDVHRERGTARRERHRAEAAESQLAELRELLSQALAAEECAVKCGEVGAFSNEQRVRIGAALSPNPNQESKKGTVSDPNLLSQ